MSLSVAFTLEVGTLTLPGEATDGLWVASLSRPARTWRRNRATSDWAHGAPQTSAVLDVTQIELIVGARAASASGLADLRAELEEAVSQWAFTMTVTEDGVATAYSCDAADIAWNAYSRGMTDALVSTASLTIPCHPIPGA